MKETMGEEGMGGWGVKMRGCRMEEAGGGGGGVIGNLLQRQGEIYLWEGVGVGVGGVKESRTCEEPK